MHKENYRRRNPRSPSPQQENPLFLIRASQKISLGPKTSRSNLDRGSQINPIAAEKPGQGALNKKTTISTFRPNQNQNQTPSRSSGGGGPIKGNAIRGESGPESEQ